MESRWGGTDASEIVVEVQSGVVTLQGTVDSRQAKRLVEDVVESSPGVKEVQNQLRVSQGSGEEHGRQGQGQEQGRYKEKEGKKTSLM